LTVSGEPPVKFSGGANFKEPDTELQASVPVPLTGGVLASALPVPNIPTTPPAIVTAERLSTTVRNLGMQSPPS
jgi:hypothetical protein